MRILHAFQSPPTRAQRRNRRLRHRMRHARRLCQSRCDQDIGGIVVSDQLQVRKIVVRARRGRMPSAPVRDGDDVHGKVADRVEHRATVLAIQADGVGRQVTAAHIRADGMRRGDLLRKARLDAKVFVHCLVVVQMVLGEVRERAARKDGVTRAVLMNRVGRNLHHAVRAAVRFHRRIDLVQLLQRRRRIARVETPRAVKDLDSRDVPAFPPRTGVQKLRQDPCRRGLAIGAGNAIEVHHHSLFGLHVRIVAHFAPRRSDFRAQKGQGIML